MYSEELVRDLNMAKRLRCWSAATAAEVPNKENTIAILRDRLMALGKWSSANMGGRWFSLYDRALNLVPIWTSLLVSMSYREMLINNVDVVPTWTKPANVPKKTGLDSGILKVALGLLSDPSVHRFVANYVFALGTYRARAGMRTADRVPPDHYSVPHTPFPKGARVAIANRAEQASGCFTKEISETIVSCEMAAFKINPEMYMVCRPRTPSGEGRMTNNGPKDVGTGVLGLAASVPMYAFLQPGPLLAMHIAARVRSCAAHTFGVHAYAALLHADYNTAKRAYDTLKMRAEAVYTVMNMSADESGLQPSCLASLQRLCQDDVYVELCAALRSTETVSCCRTPYQLGYEEELRHERHGENNGGAYQDYATVENDVPMGSAGASSSDVYVGETHLGRGESKRASADHLRAEEPCGPQCSCVQIRDRMNELLQSIFAAINGTKWLVENSFNRVRAATCSNAKVSRGRAELMMETKYAAQHSNTLEACRITGNVPIQMTLMDWAMTPKDVGGINDSHRAISKCQDTRNCKKLYRALGRIFSDAPQRQAPCDEAHQFTSVPPHRSLEQSLAEHLVCAVTPHLWTHAWKLEIVPQFTVLHHPATQKYKLSLSHSAEHMVTSWGLVAVHSKGPANNNVCFEFAPQPDGFDPDDVFIFPFISTLGAECDHASEGVGEKHQWLAVRADMQQYVTEPWAQKRGSILTIACACKPAWIDARAEASSSGFILMPNDTAWDRQPDGGDPMVEYVSIMEWSLECGMPGLSLSTIKDLLVDNEVKANILAADTEGYDAEALKTQARLQFGQWSAEQLYDELLGRLCAYRSADWKKEAKIRYYSYID